MHPHSHRVTQSHSHKSKIGCTRSKWAALALSICDNCFLGLAVGLKTRKLERFPSFLHQLHLLAESSTRVSIFSSPITLQLHSNEFWLMDRPSVHRKSTIVRVFWNPAVICDARRHGVTSHHNHHRHRHHMVSQWCHNGVTYYSNTWNIRITHPSWCHLWPNSKHPSKLT